MGSEKENDRVNPVTLNHSNIRRVSAKTPRHPDTWTSCVCSGHSAVSVTSATGKTAVIQFAPNKSLRLFNSSRPITDTKCCRLSLLATYCTRSDIDHQLCYESGCCLHGCTKASQCSQSLGGPTRWHCPAQLGTPPVLSVGVPSILIIDQFAGVTSSLWSYILIRDQQQERQSCQQPQQGAAQPRLVCWVLFACPALWSLLIGHHYTPHYPIRAWLEGETDHSGGWYALVSLNYTTPGPRLILVQSITANVSNGTDAHGEITTNIVQLTFSQGCLWPAREAQARSSTLDGSHSAVIVFLSGVLSVY